MRHSVQKDPNRFDKLLLIFLKLSLTCQTSWASLCDGCFTFVSLVSLNNHRLKTLFIWHTEQLFIALLNLLLYLHLFDSWISDVHSGIALMAHVNFGTGSVFFFTHSGSNSGWSHFHLFFLFLSDSQISPSRPVPQLWRILISDFTQMKLNWNSSDA